MLVLLTLAATAVFLSRPALLLGVDGGVLAESLSREAGVSATFEDCDERAADERWRCSAAEGGRRYEVEVDRDGCWTARPAGGGRRPSGCIGVRDYAALGD